MPKSSFSIGRSIKYTSISLYALAGVCFMIYTTQQSYTYAEGDEDLGYDISSVDASVTVGTACTFTGTVTSPHTATIANGINSTDIGTTILNTKCNDSGGYALYAIGYTGDEYGATDLTYTSLDGTTTNTGYNIATGTNTTGNTSNWSMKLSPVAGTTTATIDNGYDNYNIVPDDYTKVATLNTVTDSANTSTAAGSSVSTTYSAYISPTQPAGTYTGKVKYTLVHPSTSPKPEKPVFMQDTAKIKQLLVNENDTMQAIDKRDGKKYWITKLADSNIWMTQNLDFDIDSTKTYTSADTDLPEGAIWRPSTSTHKDPSTLQSSSYTPESYDPGDLYWNGELNSNWSGALNNMTVSDPYNTPGGYHYHIGNNYNWTAAVAMNDSSGYKNYSIAEQSICPAGWTLPLGGGEINSGSFQYLITQYGWTKDTLDLNDSQKMWRIPLFFVLGGRSNNQYLGSTGSYWSRVTDASGGSCLLQFEYYGEISASSGVWRFNSFSLRCIVR